ncbi:right-handed parallel beta-helix repeat-containing protein [Sorangium sp. So ce134]
MLSTPRLVTTRIGALLALVTAPAGAAFASSGAVWGYHPPAGESASLSYLCSLDEPYNEPPYTPSPGPACTQDTSSSTCKGTTCPCPGTAVLYEVANGCGGPGEGTCCLAGSVSPDGVVDVLPYLNRPAGFPLSASTSVDTSTVDDSPGIARAIECAASQPTARRTVAFPAGRYVLRSPLRPEHDDLTLEGPELSPDAAPGDPGTATLVAIPCNPEQFPGVVQVHKVGTPDTESCPTDTIGPVLSGVWIRNFQVALTDGPRLRANSGILINNCWDCLVENIIMRYAPLSAQPPECKPSNLEGIGFSMGAGGVIRNVIVDGTPKGGIYLASIAGHHCTPPILVENCEVKNINGPVGAGGIKIGTENVTVRNCEVHHNVLHPQNGGLSASGGHGLWIATQLPGTSHPSSAPKHVVVQDSYFHHNGVAGFTMASPVENFRPEDIELERVKFAYNGSHGVHIQAGDDVRLRDVWSWGNGYYGMYLTSRTILAPSSLRVGSVLLENPLVFDNALSSSAAIPGIMIEASDVTIDGGEIARCNVSRGKQSRSIVQQCWKTGPAGGEVVFSPDNVTISGVSRYDTTAPEAPVCTL